jgi:hypothetical protein
VQAPCSETSVYPEGPAAAINKRCSWSVQQMAPGVMFAVHVHGDAEH